MKRNRKKLGASDKIFETVNYTLLVFLMLVTLYPIVYIVSLSLSGSGAVLANKVSFYPIAFTLAAYKDVAQTIEFWVSYRNTAVYVILGVLFSLVATTCLAYPLSKKRLLYRNVISYFAAFTMYLSGGMVPWFILMKELHLRNSVWGMVIPGAVSVFNAIVLRTFFQNSIPEELEESAKIDGLGNIGILMKIYVPLSKPIYATLILFTAVDIWNSYFTALLLLDGKEMFPLQIYLRNLLLTGEVNAAHSGFDAVAATIVPGAKKSATIVLAILPIVMIYPFIQRYFVKGVMIGSIKG